MQETKVLCHGFLMFCLFSSILKKPREDRFICRHLCSQSLVLESTKNKAFNNCEEICFELTRSHNFAGEICPFEKYCKGGCPCPFYQCEKIENEKTLVPVWDLKKNEIIEGRLKNSNTHNLCLGSIK